MSVAPAPAQPLAGALDAELRGRIAEAVASVGRLLGEPDGGDAGPDALPAAIAALTERLDTAAPELGERDAQEAHELALARLRRRAAERADAFDRVNDALRELREITSPAAMLERAPAALVAACSLDRVLVSTVHGRVMTAMAASFRDDEDGARATLAALRGHPILLEHPLIEAEVLRRRRATFVTQARVHPRVDPRMTAVMAWDGYLVAPVTVGRRVVAMLHADRGRRRRLGMLERDLLWAFATGLAQAYESADLRRTLRREREQTRRFLAWLDARSGELSDAAIELVPRELPPLPALETGEALPGGGVRDDGLALTGLLTRRELEVVRLLARGRTNRGIADELVISGGTVKFHVNSILRKLHVSNRAEAVARYYALRDSLGRDRDQ